MSSEGLTVSISLPSLPRKWFLAPDLFFPFVQDTEGAAEQEQLQLELYMPSLRENPKR